MSKMNPNSCEMSYEAIGERVGLSDTAVKKQCDRALLRLRSVLKLAGISPESFREIFEVQPGAEERYLALVLSRLASQRTTTARLDDR